MFVLLVIPIVGGFVAGRSLPSKRTAMVVAGLLWAVTSVLLVVQKAVSDYDINVNLWIGVAFGAVAFATAWAGHRIRTRRSSARPNP